VKKIIFALLLIVTSVMAELTQVWATPQFADKDIKIIDNENTWYLLHNTSWKNWLHNFLRERYFGAHLEAQWNRWVLSAYNLAKKYKKIFPISWTFWSITDRDEIKELYQWIWIDIPTYKKKIRIDNKITVFDTIDKQKEEIFSIIDEKIVEWQSVLLITDSINSAKSYFDELKNHNGYVQLLDDYNNIWIYWDKMSEEVIVKDAWESWVITIATNVAWRWTDIKISRELKNKWWLVVIVTDLPKNKRVEMQARWRAWRQWNPWETFCILNVDSILKSKIKDFPDDLKSEIKKFLTKKDVSENLKSNFLEFLMEMKNILESNVRKRIFYFNDVLDKYHEKYYLQLRFWKVNKKNWRKNLWYVYDIKVDKVKKPYFDVSDLVVFVKNDRTKIFENIVDSIFGKNIIDNDLKNLLYNFKMIYNMNYFDKNDYKEYLDEIVDILIKDTWISKDT